MQIATIARGGRFVGAARNNLGSGVKRKAGVFKAFYGPDAGP